MRRGLEDVVRRPVDERGWSQAQLGMSEGGSGFRDPSKHAPAKHALAAYPASIQGCADKCRSISPGYGRRGFDKERAEEELRNEVNLGASLTGPAWERQKYFSSLVDARIREALEKGPGADGAYKQHWALVKLPGAGAWLTAPPAGDGRHLESVRIVPGVCGQEASFALLRSAGLVSILW
jgi:hypothetical protein